MQTRKRYKKRPKFYVIAVQFDLDFDVFKFQKWGGNQKCKPGDWLINNDGDVYTVDKEYFRNHYQMISPGVYNKIGEIWAEVAAEAGTIKTKEGSTDYKSGDYLVFDRPEGGEGYAIAKLKFERWYEEVDSKLNLTIEQKTYINERVVPKIIEFKTKAQANKGRFYLWQTIAIVAAALVPVFSGFINGSDHLQWLVAFLGITSAVVAGLLSLFKFQENWIRYRSTYEDLESQLAQFKIGSGIYEDKKYAFTLFADNCESILKAEIGQWAETRKVEKSSDDQ